MRSVGLGSLHTRTSESSPYQKIPRKVVSIAQLLCSLSWHCLQEAKQNQSRAKRISTHLFQPPCHLIQAEANHRSHPTYFVCRLVSICAGGVQHQRREYQIGYTSAYLMHPRVHNTTYHSFHVQSPHLRLFRHFCQ